MITHEAVEQGVHRLEGTEQDYDQLIDKIGNAKLVLEGEASHGTKEFYRERTKITKRLITEKGFMTVAAEADWPDACLPSPRETVGCLGGVDRRETARDLSRRHLIKRDY